MVLRYADRRRVLEVLVMGEYTRAFYRRLRSIGSAMGCSVTEVHIDLENAPELGRDGLEAVLQFRLDLAPEGITLKITNCDQELTPLLTSRHIRKLTELDELYRPG